ncbi:CU044_5270 family protein [[Actinomadura] parvosata]|uniref:CU044_5270 family protein n=1 Tax=[Actinomadura] parvosata TaxID=1955412 RepID=UPI00406C1279
MLSRAAVDRRLTPARAIRRRWAVRALAVAAAAVVAMAGLTAVQLHDGPIPAAHAQVILARAADAAQARPFEEPRPDQWIYTETRAWFHKALDGETVTARTPLVSEAETAWRRADGELIAHDRDGKLEIHNLGGNTPKDYVTIASLPTDPEALLALFRESTVRREAVVERIRERFAGREAAPDPVSGDVFIFGLLRTLLSDNLVPPEVEATVFRAMALLPGVTVNEAATDPEGRPALAVSLEARGWLRSELFLDPETFAYRGARETAVRDHTLHNGVFGGRGGESAPSPIPTGNWVIEAGAVYRQFTRTAIAVVDEPGQRP